VRKKTHIAVVSVILLICICFTYILYRNNPANMQPQLSDKTSSSKQQTAVAPFYEASSSVPNIEAPSSFDWRQFDGITLNFLVENNINANVLTKESQEFTKRTGITVNIRPMDFSTLIEKINMDLIAKTGKYQLVYVDPYQTLNRFATNFEDLNRYNGDPALPHIPGGLEDFFEEQVKVDSYFIDTQALYTVPFDTTTMILYYRKDIFEKYGASFKKEKGYDWTPGQPGFTWDKYCEIAEWIDQKVPEDEVKYGSGHMAQEHNSIFCDFSNVLAAYGGDYFKDENVGSLGVREPKEISVMNPNFIKALNTYKKVIKSASPQSLSWDWYDTAEAFKNGEIAMMPNWDENSSSMENTGVSKVAGKVGYSILPYGSERSANIFGGSGIGINKYANEKEKQAAWLFIVWATSPQTQLLVLKHPEGGGIPPRKSIYEEGRIKSNVSAEGENNQNYRTMWELPVVLDAWKKENAYYRPKIGSFYSIEQIIIKNLHEMIRDDVQAEDTAKRIRDQITELGGG
jgi:multiple sugar transport system substrate-binding protein